MYSELKVPMDATVAPLENVFRVIKDAHKSMVVYNFDDCAQAAFISAHDDKILITDDEDRRGKARGQLARIAMVIHSLEQAIAKAMTNYI